MTPPHPGPPQVRLLTVPEVAEALAVSVRSVRSLMADGSLKVVRVGRAVRVHADDLREFVDERRGSLDQGRGART